MERWFLAGAILALLILLFDNPLAEDILAQGQVIQGPMAPSAPTPIPVSVPVAVQPTSDCTCGANPAPTDSVHIQAPLNGFTYVQGPGGPPIQQLGSVGPYGSQSTPVSYLGGSVPFGTASTNLGS
jgi:hypothetical protein